MHPNQSAISPQAATREDCCTADACCEPLRFSAQFALPPDGAASAAAAPSDACGRIARCRRVSARVDSLIEALGFRGFCAPGTASGRRHWLHCRGGGGWCLRPDDDRQVCQRLGPPAGVLVAAEAAQLRIDGHDVHLCLARLAATAKNRGKTMSKNCGFEVGRC